MRRHGISRGHTGELNGLTHRHETPPDSLPASATLTLTLHAGDPFLMPPRTPHNATDVGSETGQMLSTYIVEVGPPLATFTGGAS